MNRTYPRRILAGAFLVCVTAFASCASGEGRDSNGDSTTAEKEDERMAITMTSPAFESGGPIPEIHTCDGEDLSPPLEWTGVPDSAKSLALICDDPDAPVGTWVHWVLFNLPPDTTSLPQGLPATEVTPTGGTHGTNDFKRLGYGGPCPPRGGPHRYFFKLYALDATLGLKAGATKKQAMKAMEGHILAQGQLMGTYKRK